MKGQKVLFSSGNDSWSTPASTYYDLDKEFNFDFDPCPLNTRVKLENSLFPDDNITEVYNGLNVEWGTNTFCNPPYSEITKWIDKAFIEYKKGKNIVLLVPSRTDTKWFHKYILPHAKEIRFVKGRLKFGGCKNAAPFPSMIIIFSHEM
tara:strand:- start:396 stop:842 length:447 start_codon:yes stop_codon:yes gene_type:complete